MIYIRVSQPSHYYYSILNQITLCYGGFLYNRDPPPSHGPVCSLFRTSLHRRRQAAGEQVKLHLPLPITCITASKSILNLPPLSPWKNCLPQNQSIVPKRLGTAAVYCGMFSIISGLLPAGCHSIQNMSSDIIKCPPGSKLIPWSWSNHCFTQAINLMNIITIIEIFIIVFGLFNIFFI